MQQLKLSHSERSRPNGPGESKNPCPLFKFMKRRSYCVYIMGSLSGTLYIGVTGNLPKRAFEHKFHCMPGFSDKYETERLLYWESYDEVHKAIGREKQLKGWSRAKTSSSRATQTGWIWPETGTHG
jgi:putative endonuclease